MTISLSRYLNKTLFVSIPALFEDGNVRPYLLLSAEMNGLWLQSQALTDRLLGEEERELAALEPAVFVPFAQIAGVLIATTLPAMPEPESDEPGSSAAAKPVERQRRADKASSTRMKKTLT